MPSRSERPGVGLISIEGPDGARDRRVCLPRAATATFEPTSAPGLGSPRPHPHLKLLHRVFKVRLRRIPPETRRVCMRARVRQCAPMHAGLCVRGCASVCVLERVCMRACAWAQRSGGLVDGATMRRSGLCVEGSGVEGVAGAAGTAHGRSYHTLRSTSAPGLAAHLFRDLPVSDGNGCRKRSTSKSG